MSRPLLRVDTSPEWNQLCPEWKVIPEPEPESRIAIEVSPAVSPVNGTAEFRIRFLTHGRPVTGRELRITVEREFHPREELTLVSATDAVVVPVTLEKPGFVWIQATGEGCAAAGGAAFAPEAIVPEPEIPGFDAFWNAQCEQSRIDVVEELSDRPFPVTEEKFSDKVTCRAIELIGGGGYQAGILASPTGAARRSLPGYVFFHGAGVRPSFPPCPWAAAGMLAFNANANGVPNDADDAAVAAIRDNFLRDYPSRIGRLPQHSHFRGMALRVLQAVNYLKSRPEWDGKNLVVHGGSQGGWQALVAAGLDRDVTLAVINAPAMCNLAGALAGRAKSWPGIVHLGQTPEKAAAAQMFDGVAFARRARCEGIFTVGFSDAAAVPSSVYAAYNVYGGPKSIQDFPDLGHEKSVFWTGMKEILETVGLA